jgi:hypothetical protein
MLNIQSSLLPQNRSLEQRNAVHPKVVPATIVTRTRNVPTKRGVAKDGKGTEVAMEVAMEADTGNHMAKELNRRSWINLECYNA